MSKEREIEDIMEKLRGINLKDLLQTIAYVILTFGQFIRKMGEIEKDFPDALEIMENLGRNPKIWEVIVDKAPPEILGILFKIGVKLLTLSSIKDINKLTPNEKIETGKMLESIAEDLQKLLTKLEGGR